MYILIDSVEVAEPLARQMLIQHAKKIRPDWTAATDYIDKCTKRTSKTGLIEINFEHLNNLLKQDIQTHADKIKIWYKKNFRPAANWLASNLEKIDRAQLQTAMAETNQKSLVKSIGHQLYKEPMLTRSAAGLDLAHPILIRNVIHNEKLIYKKIKNHLPFWFIDSGYTNFLNTGRKTWHRLVKDHIHHDPGDRIYPADRLHLLNSFPRPWRQGGTEVLVVENSDNHYRMFGTTLEHWRKTVSEQIAKHTDRPVRFRPKPKNRKNRDSIYELLLNGDFHCVVTDASAAAIESIWAGVPVIALNRHICTPVAQTSIENIENLYRGCLGDWLCALSYHQFTAREFVNGTALEIMQRYYDV